MVKNEKDTGRGRLRTATEVAMHSQAGDRTQHRLLVGIREKNGEDSTGRTVCGVRKDRWEQGGRPVYLSGEKGPRKISSPQARGPVRGRCSRRHSVHGWRGRGRVSVRPLHGRARRYALGDSHRAHRALGGPKAEGRGHPRGERPHGIRYLPGHESGVAPVRLNRRATSVVPSLNRRIAEWSR